MRLLNEPLMSLLTLPETSLASTTMLRKPETLRVKLGDGKVSEGVPLVEGKTTIGSSPQCTIVLPGTECRPLQCVLSVDADRVEATRWGAGVQLNLRDFTKSVVAAGDRLTMGACEIWFEEAARETDSAAAASPAELQEEQKELAPPAVVELAPEPALTPVAAAPVKPTPNNTVTPSDQAVKAEPLALSAPAPTPAPTVAPTPIIVQSPLSTPVILLPAPTIAPVPLASRQTVLIEAPAAEATPSNETKLESTPQPTAPVDLNVYRWTSQTFADELILQLWQSSEQSKQRAKTLIAATRDARFRTDAMAADLAAMEIELDLARAAYDSHAADHEQIHLELIERDRRAAERIGPLAAEVEQLRSQLQESQIELAEQAARCDELNAALEVEQAKAAEAVEMPAPVDANRTAELEQSLAVQIEQATILSRELGLVRTELDGVRVELERHVARRGELESELATVQAENETSKQAAVAVAERDATIAGLHDELTSLHSEREQLAEKLTDADQETARLNELCHASADRIVALELSLEDHSAATSPSDAVESEATPAAAPAIDEAAWNTEPEPVAAVAEEPQVSWEPAEAAASATVEEAAPEEPTAEEPTAALTAVEPELNEQVNEPSHEYGAEQNDFATPAPVTPATIQAVPVQTVPVESETAGASFIDKYRHLLDDDVDAAATSPAPRTAAPMIDDEFLSPAKAAARTVPADDSDEALDAYMASMMERMRGSSTPIAPILESVLPAAPVTAAAPAIDYDPSEPFDIESMKQGRKPPASTDLAALREIANTSARSAIETHRNRKKVESTFGKGIVALIAVGSAVYLMWNAPSIYDWQFGVGVVAGLIGAGAAALTMRHPGRHSASHMMADLGRE